jgi:hypothetical protein
MLGVNFILAPAQKKSVRNASARGLAMKATFINNLSTQTNDVLYNPQNPVNPDSKPGVLHTPHQGHTPTSYDIISDIASDLPLSTI